VPNFTSYGCSGLASIIIPEKVNNIGGGAFDNCNNLVKVTVCSKKPITLSTGTFSNAANALLYVPIGCKEAYEAANHWNSFKSIKEWAEDTDISKLDNVIYLEEVKANAGGTATSKDQDSSATAIYNLAGQRLTAPQRGVNIVGGKKVVVK